jgi:hypothetical protein
MFNLMMSLRQFSTSHLVELFVLFPTLRISLSGEVVNLALLQMRIHPPDVIALLLILAFEIMLVALGHLTIAISRDIVQTLLLAIFANAARALAAAPSSRTTVSGCVCGSALAASASAVSSEARSSACRSISVGFRRRNFLRKARRS